MKERKVKINVSNLTEKKEDLSVKPDLMNQLMMKNNKKCVKFGLLNGSISPKLKRHYSDTKEMIYYVKVIIIMKILVLFYHHVVNGMEQNVKDLMNNVFYKQAMVSVKILETILIYVL